MCENFTAGTSPIYSTLSHQNYKYLQLLSCCIVFDLHSLLRPLQYTTLLSWNAELQESLYLRSLIPSLFSSVNQWSHSFWSQPYCSQMLPSTIATSLKSLYHHTQKSNRIPQFQLSYEPHLQHLFWCQRLVWHFQRWKLSDIFWQNPCCVKSRNDISHLRQSPPILFFWSYRRIQSYRAWSSLSDCCRNRACLLQWGGRTNVPPSKLSSHLLPSHSKWISFLVKCKVKHSSHRYPYAWIVIGFPIDSVKFDITQHVQGLRRTSIGDTTSSPLNDLQDSLAQLSFTDSQAIHTVGCVSWMRNSIVLQQMYRWIRHAAGRGNTYVFLSSANSLTNH